MKDVRLVETQGQLQGLVEILSHTEMQWIRVCNSSNALLPELLCEELGFSSTSPDGGKNENRAKLHLCQSTQLILEVVSPCKMGLNAYCSAVMKMLHLSKTVRGK